MQIQNRIKTPKPESEFDKVIEQELLSAWGKLANIINDGLKFVDNFYAQTVSVADTGNIDTQFTVAHTLKVVPVGFIVINNDKGSVVYDDGAAWTTENIYLKCSIANCSIKIIILAG